MSAEAIKKILLEKELVNDHNPLPREDLLQVLIEIQEEFSIIPKESIPSIAESFNITRAEVYGVISFYDDLKLDENEKTSEKIIKVCQAEACQAMGVRQLMKQLKNTYGSDNSSVKIEAVYCLGNCALAPAAMINNQCLGRVDAEKIKQLI